MMDYEKQVYISNAKIDRLESELKKKVRITITISQADRYDVCVVQGGIQVT